MKTSIKASIITVFAVLGAMLSPLSAQGPAGKKPPVGVPADAKLFNGKWYRVYLDQVTWKRAQEKCRILGGQLACVHDAPTQAFLPSIYKGLDLWIGATDEKVEGVWVWADGTEMKFKAWGRHQPDGARRDNYLALGWGGHAWFDAHDNWPCVGFICEWKDR